MHRRTTFVVAFLVAATSAAGLDLAEIKAKGVPEYFGDPALQVLGRGR